MYDGSASGAPHLNTPRLIANQQGATVGKWDQQEPFGSTPPNDNPSGLGAFEFPLRFPGQYFDRETNLHYNYRRDYDPLASRYLESDPIGLQGGANTYSYVNGNPLFYTDPLGLVHWTGAYALIAAGTAKIGLGAGYVGGSFTLVSDCVNGKKGFASIRVDGFGFGAGLSLLGPISISGSTANFEDGTSEVNPDVFNGVFHMLSAGTIFWSALSEFKLGIATGTGRGWGLSTDIVGVFGASGVSNVQQKRIVCC